MALPPSCPAVTLQMLYKLKTSKVFEKPKPGEVRGGDLVEEDPYAVQMVSWCPQSRIFCVVGISAHIILYRFSKYEANTPIVVSGAQSTWSSDVASCLERDPKKEVIFCVTEQSTQSVNLLWQYFLFPFLLVF